MTEIRIQKIDGVEFVTYKDYLRLKEEKQELKDYQNLLEKKILLLQEQVWLLKDQVGLLKGIRDQYKRMAER